MNKHSSKEEKIKGIKVKNNIQKTMIIKKIIIIRILIKKSWIYLALIILLNNLIVFLLN